jgi:membrane protease YdiL (CAAX protease family)
VILVLFIATRSIAAIVNFAFPGPLAVIVSVVAAWALLRYRGASFVSLGFGRPKSWLKIIGLNLITVVAVAVIFLFVLQPLFNYLGVTQPADDAFGYLKGSPAALVFTLVFLAWGTAAFGEEIIARGFVLSRLSDALGGGRMATLIALFLHAILFGLGHFSYGLRGVITAGVIAVIFGTTYLIAGRSLWAVIPAHGIIDTISLIQTYQGD